MVLQACHSEALAFSLWALFGGVWNRPFRLLSSDGGKSLSKAYCFHIWRFMAQHLCQQTRLSNCCFWLGPWSKLCDNFWNSKIRESDTLSTSETKIQKSARATPFPHPRFRARMNLQRAAKGIARRREPPSSLIFFWFLGFLCFSLFSLFFFVFLWFFFVFLCLVLCFSLFFFVFLCKPFRLNPKP